MVKDRDVVIINQVDLVITSGMLVARRDILLVAKYVQLGVNDLCAKCGKGHWAA